MRPQTTHQDKEILSKIIKHYPPNSLEKGTKYWQIAPPRKFYIPRNPLDQKLSAINTNSVNISQTQEAKGRGTDLTPQSPQITAESKKRMTQTRTETNANPVPKNRGEYPIHRLQSLSIHTTSLLPQPLHMDPMFQFYYVQQKSFVIQSTPLEGT